MKTSIKNLKGTSREIKIILPKDTVNDALNEIVKEFSIDCDIPGFRKGKAPSDLVYKKYRVEAIDEMKRRIVPGAYEKAVAEHELSPVSYPEVYDMDYIEGGDLSFTAKVDNQPQINLKKYKGIKVECEKVFVSEKEVDETIESIRNIYAEFNDVERAAKKGDFVICDIEAFVGGKCISKKREDAWVETDKDKSLLGMGEELCGLEKGASKEMELVLPDNYPDKKYAGKKAIFKVCVKGVKEKKLIKNDEELAKKNGKETFEELKSQIKDELLNRKENNNKINMKNQMMEYLIKKHSFDLPESMIIRQEEVLMKRAKEELQKKGVDEQTIEEHGKTMTGSVKREAENKVKLYFILDEIAKKENVKVTEEDADERLKGMAEYYGKPFEEVKTYYEENNLLGGILEQIKEDKTLDMLLEEAAITFKNVEKKA